MRKNPTTTYAVDIDVDPTRKRNPAGASSVTPGDATKLTKDFDPSTLRPGVYEAVSTDRAYIELRLLANQGKADIVLERFLPQGVQSLTVRYPAATREQQEEQGRGYDAKLNPAIDEGQWEASGVIEISPKWLRDNVMRDYVAWQEAWWREAIQNSVDAHATIIDLRAEEQSDEAKTWLVSCSDNGGGMTREVMEHPEDGFLVMGGSTKKGTTGAGAFGKAKELLVLPWLEWWIRTLDSEYAGVGRQWKRRKAERPHDGVILTVRMPADMHTDRVPALAYLEKCWLPSVAFRINGHAVKTKMPIPDDAQIIHTDEHGRVHQLKSHTRTPQIYVRKNGLWMFSRELSPHSKANLIVEITAPSKDVFTQSRDDIRNDVNLKWIIEGFKTEMASEGKIKGRASQQVRLRFEGTGKIKLPERAASAQRAMGPLPPIKHGHIEVSDEGVKKLVELLEEFADTDAKSPKVEDRIGVADPAVAKVIVDASKIKGTAQYEAMIKQLVWKPDFFVVKDEDVKWHIGKRFKPDGMTATLLKLARVWAELCRIALIGLESSQEYSIGWWFSHDAAAGYLRANGEHWLLLNPFKGEMGGETYNPSKREDIASLWSKAIHEVTHMYDGIDLHLDSYSAALTRNIGLLADHWVLAKKAVAAIKLRGQIPVKDEEAGGVLSGWDSPVPFAKAMTLLREAYSRRGKDGGDLAFQDILRSDPEARTSVETFIAWLFEKSPDIERDITKFLSGWLDSYRTIYKSDPNFGSERVWEARSYESGSIRYGNAYGSGRAMLLEPYSKDVRSVKKDKSMLSVAQRWNYAADQINDARMKPLADGESIEIELEIETKYGFATPPKSKVKKTKESEEPSDIGGEREPGGGSRQDLPLDLILSGGGLDVMIFKVLKGRKATNEEPFDDAWRSLLLFLLGPGNFPESKSDRIALANDLIAQEPAEIYPFVFLQMEKGAGNKWQLELRLGRYFESDDADTKVAEHACEQWERLVATTNDGEWDPGLFANSFDEVPRVFLVSDGCLKLKFRVGEKRRQGGG